MSVGLYPFLQYLCTHWYYKMALRHLTPLSTLLHSCHHQRPRKLAPRAIPSLKKSFTISAMASPVQKVLIPIANGTEPMEAVITTDVLRRAGADVTVASVEKQLCVDACHGVKIVADSLISDCGGCDYDLISLPVYLSMVFESFLTSRRLRRRL